ncbi:early endosome antigen 1-like [Saccostrea echinata]|uniref:early endosome antigen 1-like n=1 Tax=Saccostrea echinata TaxID=191078 RepID=UPI002A834123|nr:early endosome antigen 1-like [Saccostrea echinata]
MDIYQNLTKDQALFLAYKHNELHEHSQELSFAEKVCFFHRLFLNCQRNYAGQPHKTISTKWRSDIAAIMNKSKTDLKNSYKVHLNLAASENDIWELIKDVFNAFENGCIKGQKRAEQCSQYCFWHFSKVKNNELKISLLTRFKNGEMMPEEFRSACQRCERENDQSKPSKHEPLTNRRQMLPKKRKAADVVTENQDECTQSKKKSEKETGVQTENENLLYEKEEEIKRLQQQITLLSEKLKHAEQSVEQQKNFLKEKDSKIIALKKSLLAILTKAEEQKVTEANLNKTVTELQEKLKDEIQNKLHAEDAAARARQNLQLTSSGHQKCLEKNKGAIFEERPQECSTSEKKINKGTKDNQDSEVVLVEYTKGKIYYALRNRTILTYCHKHVGVIQDDQFLHRPQKLSFKINEKDQQTFEEEFIILSMKGDVEEKMIKIDKLSASIDEQLMAVNNYIKEK